MFAFLNINKPSGITSHKVISILRKLTGIKQIGHAGTLDPLASGVLPVALGKATKLIDYLPDKKSYEVSAYLGKISDTFDIEGKVEETGFRKIERSELEAVLNKFRGEIMQIPPAYSAVHYNGKRLYELAREGKIPDNIPSRTVQIFKNEIKNFDYDNQTFSLEISCSKGTYIRTVINDIGLALGAGAVMYKLVRTLSAAMELKNSLDLTEEITLQDINDNLIPPQDLLDIKKAQICSSDAEKIKHGMIIKNTYNAAGNILLLNNNSIVSIARADRENIAPIKVFL